MTTGAGRDAERFAAAVDNGHRYGGSSSPGDEELARDLELVALLRSSRESLAPSADASARMRAKVMAAAATMMAQPPVAEDSSETTSPDLTAEHGEVTAAEEETNVVSIGTAKGRHRFPRRSSSSSSSSGTATRRGGLGISAAAALALLAATGGGALFSKDALPGDTLYGVKQATESGQIALSGQGKAQRQLDIAATRIDEVQKLNSSRASSDDRGADIQQALQGFNEQTTAASRTWLAGPNSNKSSDLASWAGTQSQRLSGMRASMPEAAKADADDSIRMLEQLKARANALNSRKGCDTVTTGQTDQFGPIPARGACSAKDTTPTRQVLPSVPSVPEASQRSSAPSLNTRSGSGNGGNSSQDDNSDSAPGLLPDLPGTDAGGLLPNRVPTSDNTPAPEPGLLGGLLGGG